MGINKNQTDRYFYTEYKKHFLKNISPLFCYAVVFIAIATLILVGLKQYTTPNLSNLKALNEGRYEYVVESSEKYEQFAGMYKLDNLVSVYNEAGKHYNVNYYMKNESATLNTLQETHIASGELVLSKKIATKIGVQTGDSVSVDMPISDEKSSFKIVGIMPFLNDFYNVIENVDFSVAIIGYNKTFEETTTGKYVYFLSADEMNQFLSDELSYKEIYEVSQECSQLEKKVEMAQWSVCVIFLLISSAYLILINREITSESKKYYYDVAGVKFVNKIYLIDHIMFYAFPMVVFYTLLGCFDRYNIFDNKCYLILAIVNIFHFIMIQIGGSKFGKTNRI